jgi:phospholipid/cholesterol/gamma-HCH transport system substrate-binding protein
METRAHHILIGVFITVIAAVGLSCILWLGKAGADREFKRYEVVFEEAVSGLTQGGAVEFNGIRVGSIDDIGLDASDPSKVKAIIRVDASLPIRTDTRARLHLTGITGISSIRLANGAGGTPLSAPDGRLPVIPAEPSSIARLLSSGEDMVLAAGHLLGQARALLSDKNIENISLTLEHLEQTTRALAAERQSIQRALGELSQASERFDAMLNEAGKLIANADRLLDDQGQKTLASAQASMAALEHAMQTIDQLLADNRVPLGAGIAGLAELGPAIAEFRSTLASIRTVSRQLENQPAGYLLGLEPAKEFQP